MRNGYYGLLQKGKLVPFLLFTSPVAHVSTLGGYYVPPLDNEDQR